MTDLRVIVGTLFAHRWGSPEWPDVPGAVLRGAGERGWYKIHYTTSSPLIENTQHASRSALSYEFLLRISGSRFFFGGEDQDTAHAFLQKAGIRRRVTFPTIDVARLVRDLVTSGAKYQLSTVFARIDGYGAALKSVGFYGADITDAKPFRDMLPIMTPFRVNLRDPKTLRDVINVGNHGECMFTSRGRPGLIAVDTAFRFLTEGNYISWEFEPWT